MTESGILENMNDHRSLDQEARPVKSLGSLLTASRQVKTDLDSVCPACGSEVQQQKCKVVCRSEQCVYRIIYNCSEF